MDIPTTTEPRLWLAEMQRLDMLWMENVPDDHIDRSVSISRPRAFLKQIGNKDGTRSYKTLGKAWGRSKTVTAKLYCGLVSSEQGLLLKCRAFDLLRSVMDGNCRCR
jgi:hypothetical protein